MATRETQAARRCNAGHGVRRAAWRMGLQAGALLAVGACLSLGALFATVTNPEKQKKPEPRPCCPIGIAYLAGEGKVTLVQVCNRKGRSIFHFRTKDVGQACTHPPGTVLRDQKGRRYNMLSFSGLPGCSSGQFSSDPNTDFHWEFQQLRGDVQRFTLLETEDAVTAGLSFWAWRDVDVSHCKFGG